MSSPRKFPKDAAETPVEELIGQVQQHDRQDPHGGGTSLAEVILGGQDGLVNVLGVILGIAAAGSDTRILLAGGLAAAFAESISMAAVAYTSSRATGERYEAERAREHRHLRNAPEVERHEIRQMFRRKGIEGELLDRIVDRITADPEVWVAVMMAEEHQLQPVSRRDALGSALIVGISAVIGSLLPLLPFFFLPILEGIALSIVLSAAILFAVGAYKARVTIGRPIRGGMELAAIGMASALVGYAVGLLFRAPPA